MAVPPIGPLHHFTVVCPDVDASLAWYQRVLGARVVRAKRVSGSAASPGGFAPVGIEVGGTVIDLFQADESWQPYPGSGGQHYAFSIKWEDVDGWFAHLKEQGIDLMIHPAGEEFLSLYFDDPSGYHLELSLHSLDKELVRRERDRLMKTYGRVYHWEDGNRVPPGQPQGVWVKVPTPVS